jgi:LacI family transcriptional regulator
MVDTIQTAGSRLAERRTTTSMKDVAIEANVSISTVSHVLNNTRPVAEKTRSRILESMRKLNYYQNVSGRRLARGRSDAFGLIISDIENPFFPELIKTFEQSVFKIGFDALLSTTNYDPNQAKRAVRRMIENQVQGVAVMTSQLDKTLVDELLANDIPVVLLNGGVPSRGRSNVHVDYLSGAREVVEYLRNMGHRRIDFISGQKGHTSANTYKQAFKTVLQEKRLRDARYIEGDETIEGGHTAMLSLLGKNELATAVICGNDLMALGAIRALAENGIAVPAQVSIFGADDISFARYAYPPLSTVRVDRYQIGKLAFQALQRFVRTKKSGGIKYVVDTHLVVRGSSAAARSSQ